MMLFIPKIIKGKSLKSYCATCGKVIKDGDVLAWSTTKKGTVKIHHQNCEKIK